MTAETSRPVNIMRLILIMISCTALFDSSHGLFCPVSLPQNVPWWSPCLHTRTAALIAQKIDYGIQTPTQSMPFARYHLGIPKLLALLLKDPFLKVHSDKWLGLAAFNELSRVNYLHRTSLAPRILSMSDFAFIAQHFKESPKKLFDGFVKAPSDFEPFEKVVTKWISDGFFADQRLAGSNPMTLKRITFSNEIGIHWNHLKPMLNVAFDWENAISKALNEIPLETAIKEGYLYVLYHPLSNDLRTMKDNGDKDPKRKMWNYLSPIALFASAPSKARLLPVAIQMDHKPDSQVYTPKDGDLWTLAKLNVQLTDFESSQIVEHLSKVHFLTEGLCLSVENHLSYQHPLYVIMRFHCRGIFVANTFGGPVLLSEKNKLDNLFPYGNEGSTELVKKASKLIEWSDINLKNNMKRRGVDDTRRLPYYPYRDDGAEIENVIRLMVTDYVDAYYGSNSAVTKDSEVQHFAREVSTRGKVKIRGFPSSLNSKGELVDTFTQMIYLMSGHHVAVNYPMIDYVAYVPNTPLKLYDSERVTNTTFSPERLPNREETADQVALSMSLASYRHDRLFDYSGKLKDSKARDVVSRYFNRLRDVVDPLLEKRNKERLAKGHLTYPYMQPRWVPNGVQT